jgi:hypothetical protein
MSSCTNRLDAARTPLLVLVVAPRAQAATWFVADTGTDSGGCGVSATAPCGQRNIGVSGLVATNNYWGAPAGPDAGAGDLVCEINGGTTDVTPFATKPFAVKNCEAVDIREERAPRQLERPLRARVQRPASTLR